MGEFEYMMLERIIEEQIEEIEFTKNSWRQQAEKLGRGKSINNRRPK